MLSQRRGEIYEIGRVQKSRQPNPLDRALVQGGVCRSLVDRIGCTQKTIGFGLVLGRGTAAAGDLVAEDRISCCKRRAILPFQVFEQGKAGRQLVHLDGAARTGLDAALRPASRRVVAHARDQAHGIAFHIDHPLG